MSERGSFVTEYIHCKACLKAVRDVLVDVGRDKFLCSQQIISWCPKESPYHAELLPIVAGKVGSTFAGGEVMVFEDDYIPQLEKRICHPVRIAVLGEQGQRIFYVEPE